MAFKARFSGVDFSSFATDYRTKSDANITCAKDLDFDVVDVMSDPYSEAEGFGAVLEFPADDHPRCPNPPLADSKDLDMLREPNPFGSARMSNTVNTVRAYRERVYQEYSIHGWVEGPAAEAANLRGIEAYLMDVRLDPGWCAELMDICTDVAIEFARAQIENGADVVGVGDSICSQLPPDVYSDMVAPRQQKLFEAIHSAGSKVRLHICGYIEHLLPFIKDLSIDLLDVDSLTDISTAREILGHEMTLAGNLDPVRDLLEGTPENIRKSVRDVYEKIGNPMVVSAGCEIPRDTLVENVRAICEPGPYR